MKRLFIAFEEDQTTESPLRTGQVSIKESNDFTRVAGSTGGEKHMAIEHHNPFRELAWTSYKDSH